MKKIVFLFAFLANCYGALSQKCETLNDPITGEKLVTANLKDRWVYLENKNGNTKFQLIWSFIGSIGVTVPKGSTLNIKLENGEIINLVTVSDAEPRRHVSPQSVNTWYTYETVVDKSVLEKLAASRPMLIRLPDINAGSPDITTKFMWGNKYFKAIHKGAKYILANT